MASDMIYDDMKVYSEHSTWNIVNNKTQYKEANITTILQSTMFEKGKFDVNDFWHELKYKGLCALSVTMIQYGFYW